MRGILLSDAKYSHRERDNTVLEHDHDQKRWIADNYFNYGSNANYLFH